MNWWRSLSLGAKLNFALLAFLVLLGSATLAIIIYGFNRTQDSAQERSNAALEEQGKQALQAFIGGISSIGSLQLEAAAETGRRAALYVGAQAPPPGAVDTLTLAVSASGHYYDPDPARAADLVVISGVDPNAAGVRDDITFSEPLDTAFPILLQGFQGAVGGRDFDPIAIVFISTNGVTRYYPPTGIHDVLPPNADFTDRMSPIGPANNPERRTIWTPPYEDGGGQGQIITARTPVYDGETFRGSLEVDVSIARLTDQLNGIKPSPRGFAFYVDSAGGLFRTDAFDLISSEAEDNPQLAATLTSMQAGETSFPVPVDTLEIQGEPYFIAHLPIDGPGGSVGVAAPVSDITANAATITAGIDDEANRTIWFMVAAMAALFVAGLAGAAFLNRQALVKPIGAIVAATRSVAAGDLDARVPVSGRHDELGELGQSFNAMVEQLQESERTLERRVDQRTRELTTLLEVSREIASELSLDELVQTLVRVANELFDTTGASIASVDEDGWATLLGSDYQELAAVAIGMRYSLPEAGAIWNELRQGRGVVMGNVRGDGEMAAAYQRWMGPALDGIYRDIRSWMGVPFMARGRLIGWMTISHTEPNRFEESDLRIAMAMGSQAAVAFENVRLYDEAVQRTSELNTLLAADSELHRSLALDTVLESLVDVMVDSLKVDKCIVSLRQSESGPLVIRAHRNFRPESIERFNEIYAATNRQGGPVVIKGVITHEDTSTTEPAVRAILEKEGVCATLDAPILTPDGLAGGFDLGYTSPHTFTPNELRLAGAIAERAGVAIRNAQLVDEAAKRTRETEALLRADAELFQSLSLETVLQALVDVAVDVLGVDKSIVILHEGDIDVVRASRNYSLENLVQYNKTLAGMPHVEPPPGGAVPREYEDVSQAPAFIAEAAAREGIASHIAVPVRDDERMLGVFGVSFLQRHAFTEDEKRLFSALADRAAMAIQNAELYERAQQVASLEERQRLARELHDSVSQALFGIALGARTARLRIDNNPATAAEPIEYVMSLAEAGLAEMRALIFELRPESLESEGLVVALEKQAAATQARYGLPIELKLGDEPVAPIEVKEALYRITQEATHNVVKHANATKATVTLSSEGDTLVVAIQDDGRGFNADGSFPGHVGLVSMRERVAKLGGMVKIESAEGKGTRVVAHVPTRVGASYQRS